jgi:hypothetical protein
MNQTKRDINSSILDNIRTVSDNNDVRLANNLEKEAELYYEKANMVRKDADLIEDLHDKEKEYNKSKNLEFIALQKQRYAIDLYLKSKEESSSGTVVAENSSNRTSANITLHYEEEDALKDAKQTNHRAEVLENEALKNLTETDEKRKKAESSYSESQKKELLKGVEKEEHKNKNNLLEAYKLYGKSDSLKYSVYKNQLTNLYNSVRDIGQNKKIAKQYMKDADFYYAEAEKTRKNSANITNLDDKLKNLKRAVDLEKKALNSQELAVDILANTDTVEFVSDNTLMKIDRLEAMNEPVDVEDVVKIKTNRIVDKLNLSEETKRKLDEGNKQRETANNLIADAKNEQTKIDSLKKIISSSADSKTVKKADKEKDKLEKDMFAKNFTAAEIYENVNDAKYYTYKDNLSKNRLNDNSLESRQGTQLEKDANDHYRRAKSLRDRAFITQDPGKAYQMVSEAKDLEEQAIEEQEKAFGLYLKLRPLDDEIKEFAEARKAKNEKANNLIIKSKADVTPIKTDTTLVAVNTDNTNVTKRSSVDSTAAKCYVDIIAPDEITAGKPADIQLVIHNYQRTDFAKIEQTLPEGYKALAPPEFSKYFTFVDQKVKFVWEKLPSEEFITVKYSILNDNPSEPTLVLGGKFQLITDNNIYSSDIKEKKVKVNMPAVVADNTNKTNITDNTNKTNVSDNTNKTNITDNTNKTIVSDNTNTNKTIKNTTNTNSSTGTLFSVLKVNAYSDANPIPFNVPLPAGIVFKVQIGAFRNLLKNTTFKGLNPLSSEKEPGSELYKYLVGLFRSYEGAREVQSEVKKLGYTDAFVVAYKDGKRIPLWQAREFLAQQNNPDYSTIAQNEVNQVKTRTNIADNNVAVNNVPINTNRNAVAVSSSDVKSISGLFYTVQIGVYKEQVSSEQLKNISPVYREQTQYGWMRYTTGIFNDLGKATDEKNKIVGLGINDAFVSAYYNGKKISLNEAAAIAAKNPNAFTNPVNIKLPEENISPVKNYTPAGPVNISFRVQIGAYKEEIPTEVVNGFLKVSTDKGLEQFKDESGTTLYVVGKYKTYEEASKMKDILINEGIRDAFVVAFNGKQKISVEDAKRLLGK